VSRMERRDGRKPNEVRPIEFTPGITHDAHTSVQVATTKPTTPKAGKIQAI